MEFTALIHEISKAVSEDEIRAYTDASFRACSTHCINSLTKDEKTNIEMIHNLTCEYQKNIFTFISSFQHLFTPEELRVFKSEVKTQRYKTANNLIKVIKDGDIL